MPTTRSLTYEFKAKFDSLRGGLVAAGKSVDDFGKKLTGLDARGDKMRRGLSDVGNAAGKIGLGAAAGLAAIVGVTANFEKAMSGVQAATHESTEGMKALRDAAIEAGAETAFSASEAAGGIEALAKAGVTTEEILSGGLQGALDLAAAGSLEVADAAEAAASAMAQFGLEGEDVPHIADLLSAAAGKAQGEVSDMAQALNQSGIIASQTGLSIEETTGALAAFAEKGLLGSDAGTSFKTMLGALTPNSERAATEMERLGISAYDAQGNFIGLTGFADSLQKGMADLSEEQRAASLEVIFGSDAVRAASILYENGADGVQSWIDKVDDSGFAAETAAIKLDNLAGDWEALTGSVETALIGMGTDAQGPLREVVQGLTDVVNAFSDLPDPAQSGVTALFGLTAAFGGLLFIGTRIVTGMVAVKGALVATGLSAERAGALVRTSSRVMGAAAGLGIAFLGREVAKTNKAMGTMMTTAGGVAVGFAVGGPWGAAIGGAIGLLVGLTAKSDAGKLSLESFTAALDDQTGALTENNRVLAQKSLQDSGVFDDAESLGFNLSLVTDAALGNAGAIRELNGEMEQYAGAIAAVESGSGPHNGISLEDAEAAQRVQAAIGEVNDVVEESAEKWDQNKEAAGDAAGANDEAATAIQGVGAETEKTTKSIKDLTEAMEKQKDAAVAAFDAETAYRQALKDTRKQADKNNAGIEGDSKKALANRDAISGLASAWNSQSKEVRNNMDAYKAARTNFIDIATDMGVPIEKARELADELLKIPRDTIIKTNHEATARLDRRQFLEEYHKLRIDMDTIEHMHAAPRVEINKSEFEDDLASVKRGLRSLEEDTVNITLRFQRFNIPIGATESHAAGGLINGPGTGTSDSIPAYVSRGEYVVRAAAVEKYGVAMFDRLNAMRFAAGGPVPSALPGGGGVAIDYDRLAGAMLRARPLYGNVHISGDPAAFKRELAADARRASLGGFS